MVPLTKNQHKWGFACGRISVLESQLLPLDFFLSLVALERPEDLFHRLQDTPLRESLIPGAASWEDWSTIVDTYVHNHAVTLRRETPDPSVSNLFLLAQDYLNLKRAVLERGSYPFLMGVFPEERLSEVAAGNPSLLPADVRVSINALKASLSGEDNAFLADVVLDGAYLRHSLSLSQALNVPLITACVDHLVLSRAVVVVWRAVRAGHPMRVYQQHFLPLGAYNGVLGELMAAPDPKGWGGILPGVVGDLLGEALQQAEDEQIVRFEQLSANHLTQMAKHGKLQTAGPERVFGYLWGLLVEAYNFKLVIRGRLNRIDPDVLKQRLRECYV